MIVDNMNLPPIKADLKDFEKSAQISVDVFVRIRNFQGIHNGRYIHAIQKWQVNNINGDVDVVEWWPLPENGTGFQVEVKTDNENITVKVEWIDITKYIFYFNCPYCGKQVNNDDLHIQVYDEWQDMTLCNCIHCRKKITLSY